MNRAAKHLSVSLPASPIKLKPRSFDLLETEGSLELAATAPVNLELLDLVEDEVYSEWYLTIDVPKKSITLSEKNSEYRQPFFNAFTR